jgi:hypothetical protein
VAKATVAKADLVCRFGPGFLPRLLDHLRTQLPDACGAGMSVLSSGEPPRVAAANGVAEALDELQWKLREGPLIEAHQTEQVVRAVPLFDEAKWSRFTDVAATTADGVAGALFVPGTWDQAGPVLLSVYLSTAPDADTLREVERLEPLLATALGMAEFCAGEHLRAEDMLIMMQYRRVIEQAKGAVMVTLGCDADTAFETLVRSSQHFNVRLRELAVAVAERVSGGGAQPPVDDDHVLVITDRERAAAEQMWSAISHRGVVPVSVRTESIQPTD